MTDEDAKTRQCCGPEGSGYFNDNPYPARWCIGSGCMAWRSKPIAVHEVTGDDQAASWVAAGWTKAVRKHDGQPIVTSGGGGFCGLAGAPHD